MKRLLLLISLFITSYTINAQRFRVGLMAGVALTDVDGTDLTDNDNDFIKGGFTIGGLVNTKIGSLTQLQLEISYIQKGSEALPDSTNNNNYYSLNLNYVDISLSVRQPIHLAVNKKMSDKYGLLFGLTYGSLVYHSYTVKSNPTPVDLNNFDDCVFAGFYYNFTPNFFFDLRYSNSIIPAIRHDASANALYPFYNSWNAGDNVAFEIRLGFKFGSAEDIGSGPANSSPKTDSDN